MTERKARARKGDPSTSREAASKVNVDATRDIVRAYAIHHPDGFIDAELEEDRSDLNDQDLRSRRGELRDENWIIDTGEKRKNKAGNNCTIWKHREYVPNPPPLIARANKPAKKTRKDMLAEIERLQGILDTHGIGY